MSLTYSQIVGRLEEIEKDLGERQEPYSAAAEEKHRLVKDLEKRLAAGFMVAKGSTATEKRLRALDALVVHDPDFWQSVVDAEARYEGSKAAVKVLEQRAMIGMALLKSVVREPGAVPDGRRFAGVR